MKALRVIDRRVDIADLPRPGMDGEAVVRVIKSGICNTDLEIARVYAGFNGTIGHEFVGVVEASDDQPALVGTRVVGEINAGGGKCDLCIAGDQKQGQTPTVLWLQR